MKKFLSLILVGIMCFALVGCGETENGGTNKDPNNNNEYQGSTEGSGDNLKDVTAANYTKIAKNIFGVELDNTTGWTLKEAKSPNKVNNLNISWNISSGSDAKTILENYFNKCKALSKDGVYSQGINESYTAVVKKNKYDTFESFFTKEGKIIGDYYSVMWIYDNNGKNVQFGLTITESSADMSFVLLG